MNLSVYKELFVSNPAFISRLLVNNRYYHLPFRLGV